MNQKKKKNVRNVFIKGFVIQMWSTRQKTNSPDFLWSTRQICVGQLARLCWSSRQMPWSTRQNGLVKSPDALVNSPELLLFFYCFRKIKFKLIDSTSAAYFRVHILKRINNQPRLAALQFVIERIITI